MDAMRERLHVAVAADVAVRVPDVHHVAVPRGPSRPDHDAVADGAHRRARGGRVIGALVLLPDAEDRMKTQPVAARDAPELDRRPKEASAHRLSGLVEEIAADFLAGEADRLG